VGASVAAGRLAPTLVTQGNNREQRRTRGGQEQESWGAHHAIAGQSVRLCPAAHGARHRDLLRFAGWQVDWILGKNPPDVSFLRGFGKNNPPPFCASKSQAGTLVGGDRGAGGALTGNVGRLGASSATALSGVP
jgi:hypothetical protein